MSSPSDKSFDSFKVLTPARRNGGVSVQSPAHLIEDSPISNIKSNNGINTEMPKPIATDPVNITRSKTIKEVDSDEYIRPAAQADELTTLTRRLQQDQRHFPFLQAHSTTSPVAHNSQANVTDKDVDVVVQPFKFFYGTSPSISLEDIKHWSRVLEGLVAPADVPDVVSRLLSDPHNLTSTNDATEDPDDTTSHCYLADQLVAGEICYPAYSIGDPEFGAGDAVPGSNRYFGSQPIAVIVGVGQHQVTHHIHKQVLAVSRVLEVMCEEKTAEETKSITLPDDDPVTFEHVVGYLYFQTFHGSINGVRDTIMKVYNMAQKYKLAALGSLCLEIFPTGIPTDELLRLSKIVYDSNTDDCEFRDFFKRRVTAALMDNLHRDDGMATSEANDRIAEWGYFGGNFGYDLTHALLASGINRDRAVEESDVIPTCRACGEQPCARTRLRCGNYGGDESDITSLGRQGSSSPSGSRPRYPIETAAEEAEDENKSDKISTGITDLKDRMQSLPAQVGSRQKRPMTPVQYSGHSWVVPAPARAQQRDAWPNLNEGDAGIFTGGVNRDAPADVFQTTPDRLLGRIKTTLETGRLPPHFRYPTSGIAF